jgi:ferric-dicitrate binding protein FerR (iron transport regulator)
MSQGQCEAVRELFLALEEGALARGEAEAARAHLAGCEACRRAWEQWQADDRSLRQALRAVPAPRDVAGAVVEQVRRGRGAPMAGRRRLVLRWGLASAAAAAVVVVGGLWLFGKRYERVGQVADLKGEPMARQRGARFASVIEIGSPIYNGDVLLMGEGSELSVALDDGSMLEVGERTEAQLSGSAGTQDCGQHFRHVCLREGEVEFKVHSTRYFQGVGTPLGSVVVEGTKFRVKYVKEVRMLLEVAEGEVTFSCPGGEVRVGPGKVWVLEAAVGRPRPTTGAAWR